MWALGISVIEMADKYAPWWFVHPMRVLFMIPQAGCLLPAKFSKRFWIKRGNFVVIEFTVANDGTSEGKSRGTITHILYPDQLKRLRREGNAEW